MNTKRIVLAFWYGLATLLVQGLHDHREDRNEPVAVAMVGCDDPRPHYSGHGAPDLSRGDTDCPACQFRVSHQAIAAPITLIETPCVRVPLELDPLAFPSTAPSRATCRGPPLA